MALTPQAEVQVELRDVSRPDAASTSDRQAGHRDSRTGAHPLLSRVRPDEDPRGRTYAVSARIVDRGQLQFVTDTRFPVLTGAAQGPIEIVVVPVR